MQLLLTCCRRVCGSGGVRFTRFNVRIVILKATLGLILGNVKMRIDDLWYWLYFCAQFLFDFVKRKSLFKTEFNFAIFKNLTKKTQNFLSLPVVISDEIDGNAQMTKSTRSTDTMQIGLGHLWKVKVNYNVNGLYVNASGEQIFIVEEKLTFHMSKPVYQ